MRRLFLFLAFLIATPLFAEEADRVEIVEDREKLVTEVQISANDGEIALSDVFRAIARVNGYDDLEIRNSLPEGRVSLDGRGARWTINAVNRVLKPCVHVSSDNASLNIQVDRASARKWVNDCKKDVRWGWNRIDWRTETPDYGLDILGIAEAENADFVVLVHGLNSRPEDVAALIPIVEQADLIPATFRYPNDQPITDSATLLASELRILRTNYPNRKVRLLTHSMGGLVARAVVETDLDPGNVSQLIMIAPPNHGSSLARVATFMDCYEFFTSAEHRRAGVLVESVSDGLGEATSDVSPRSVFLDRLNAKERNSNIRYTILLGTSGPMEQSEMNSLRKTVRDYTDNNRFTRFVSSKLNDALDDLDEVVAGRGDGAVSCERGKLEGVDDVIELPFSHASVLNANAPSSQKAFEIILNRLR